MNIVGCDAM